MVVSRLNDAGEAAQRGLAESWMAESFLGAGASRFAVGSEVFSLVRELALHEAETLPRGERKRGAWSSRP